jgi:hypothetical protein
VDILAAPIIDALKLGCFVLDKHEEELLLFALA